MVAIPAAEPGISPHTGYTRRHWEAVADELVRAAWRHASERGALLHLPGRPSVSGVRSDGLEGYARTFLTAAFRTAGAGGADPHGWLDRYAAGLTAGTHTPGRDDPESWPVIGDHRVAGQPMVESASVALGLRLTRPWLWDRLDAPVRDRVEHWLRGALDRVPAPNNWYLFPYTVAGFLESVGRGDARTARARERAVELLDAWYRGQGWYSDGDGRSFDHYNGWALHLYPVLDAHLAGSTGPHGARLREHLASYGLMFGADGAPLHVGRSLTYRFAAGAAVALGAVTGHTPFRAGVSRRLVSGTLRHFLERGAVAGDGLLTLGWHGPHEPTLQSYSGPASPYWASKAFVGLLAPESHPLWTATEEPAPVEETDRVRALPGPGLLLHTTRADGVVRLHNHGSDHVAVDEGERAADEDPLYARQAYSTRTGPTAPDNPRDNHLAVVVGGVRSARRRIHPLGAGEGTDWGWAASWHRPVFPSGPPVVPGLRVESVTVARGPHELRVHRVHGAPYGARVEQTGWATGTDEGLVSALYPLHGFTPGPALVAPRGTAFTRTAAVPCLTGAGSGLFAALVILSGAGGTPPAEVATAHVEEDGTLEVRWCADGARTRVAFAPLSVTHEAAPT